ncbi:MAG TPA: hypothetical protein DCE41_17165 [Cytophagales bacterium]|nr:hypothetical protein [Cytophagales bacterium]HAA18208.1 hypothetical protein [Cytophagales bacterium]
MGLPTGNPGTLQLSLTYDYNNLETLYEASQRLDDDTRTRNTHSLLLEIGYQLSSRWQISALFTGVRQERNLRPIGLDPRNQQTTGLGDAVLLARFSPISLVSIGLGTKLPTGPFSITDPSGIQYNADLQPGSGAWDGIAWLQTTLPWALRPQGAWSVTAIGRLTGTNEEFRFGQSYRFGNDVQVIGGYTDRVFVANQIADLSGMFRYRWAGSDLSNGGVIPNTGGNWVFFNPGLTWWPTPQFSWQVNAEMPVFTQVDGVQLSPTWRINSGIYFIIGNKDNEDELDF